MSSGASTFPLLVVVTRALRPISSTRTASVTSS